MTNQGPGRDPRADERRRRGGKPRDGSGVSPRCAPLCSNTEMMATQARLGETVREATSAVTGYAQEMAGAAGRMRSVAGQPDDRAGLMELMELETQEKQR